MTNIKWNSTEDPDVLELKSAEFIKFQDSETFGIFCNQNKQEQSALKARESNSLQIGDNRILNLEYSILIHKNNSIFKTKVNWNIAKQFSNKVVNL